MKKAYWLLLVFGVWCTGCGIWYLSVMKGLRTDPRLFEPHLSTVAIIEILVMLLVACLLGYAIGWSLRDEPIASLQINMEQLEAEKDIAINSSRAKDEQLRQLQQQGIQAQQNFTIRVNKAKQESDSLKNELAELGKQLNTAKELAGTPQETAQLENEIGTLRYRVKQLEFQNQELEEGHRKLQHDLQESIAKQSRKAPEPIHPFVRPVEMSERDDLTLIKGIGPFIEKRLNMVGIYTFRQISEFTPETIEHITKAIEFFPNRVVKDDWVGQATKLLSR